jgi:hypothetical protein
MTSKGSRGPQALLAYGIRPTSYRHRHQGQPYGEDLIFEDSVRKPPALKVHFCEACEI